MGQKQTWECGSRFRSFEVHRVDRAVFSFGFCSCRAMPSLGAVFHAMSTGPGLLHGSSLSSFGTHSQTNDCPGLQSVEPVLGIHDIHDAFNVYS